MPTKNIFKEAKNNFQKGRDLQQQGNLEESIESYQQAVKIEPDY